MGRFVLANMCILYQMYQLLFICGFEIHLQQYNSLTKSARLLVPLGSLLAPPHISTCIPTAVSVPVVMSFAAFMRGPRKLEATTQRTRMIDNMRIVCIVHATAVVPVTEYLVPATRYQVPHNLGAIISTYAP